MCAGYILQLAISELARLTTVWCGARVGGTECYISPTWLRVTPHAHAASAREDSVDHWQWGRPWYSRF